MLLLWKCHIFQIKIPGNDLCGSKVDSYVNSSCFCLFRQYEVIHLHSPILLGSVYFAEKEVTMVFLPSPCICSVSLVSWISHLGCKSDLCSILNYVCLYICGINHHWLSSYNTQCYNPDIINSYSWIHTIV